MLTRFPISTMAAALALCSTLSGQDDRGAFVVRLGTDTVTVERYQRTATGLEGRYVTRSPRTTMQHYVVTLGPGGAMTRLESTSYRGDALDGRPTQRTVAVVRGDSLAVEVRRGDSTRTWTVVASGGTVPVSLNSYAMIELLTRQARRGGTVGIWFLGSQEAATATVGPLGVDSLAVTLDDIGPLRVRVDADGRVLGVTGVGSVFGYTAERLPDLDVQALAREFAARDAAGRGLGVLSPRDSLTVRAGGATVSVNYGRPARRGRAIFGAAVPWNNVWRTGANEATHFTTDAELQIGGVTVPAGTYTLWTLPSPSGWQLIINRRTREWGTEYDAAHDLARIPMQVESLPEPVERLTITVDPRGEGGVLAVAWDRTRAWVAFRRTDAVGTRP